MFSIQLQTGIALLLCFCSIGCWAEDFVISGVISCTTYDQDSATISFTISEGSKVQLWEHDTLDPDDHLSEGKDVESDVQGSFKVMGSESENGDTEPYLLVEHECKDPMNPLTNPDCVYESRIELKPQPERQHLQIWLGDLEYVGLEAKGIDELKISTKQKCP